MIMQETQRVGLGMYNTMINAHSESTRAGYFVKIHALPTEIRSKVRYWENETTKPKVRKQCRKKEAVVPASSRGGGQ